MADPEHKMRVRINTVGQASRVWKGAKNQAEADELNNQLSQNRAEAVRARVSDILRANIRTPGVTIESPTSRPSNGLVLAAEGRGSRISELRGGAPDENEAHNRIVTVIVEVLTSLQSFSIKTRPSLIRADTRSWRAKVMNLKQLSAGISTWRIDLVLRNTVSNRQIKASALLNGGNVSTSSFPTLLTGTGPIGHEVAVETDEAMGFDDFNKVIVQLVNMEVSHGLPLGPLGKGPGFRAKGMYLSFLNLGPGAQKLVFFKDTGSAFTSFGASYALVSGPLVLTETNPGDSIAGRDVAYTDPKQIRDANYDGLTVFFPTEKYAIADLPRAEQNRLEDFARKWASTVDGLLKVFTLAKR
jgi:hypothetical protein